MKRPGDSNGQIEEISWVGVENEKLCGNPLNFASPNSISLPN